MFKAERERFIAGLKRIHYLTVFPSEANYVLCQVSKPFTAADLTLRLWVDDKVLIKDCSSKKGFDGTQFIRIAIHDERDNDYLLKSLAELQ
jgi:histidinol-phosphate/aromatic aminotransferase/cobyric acid decarboxylase-like protein